MNKTRWMLLALLAISYGTRAEEALYVECLWTKPPQNSVARQQAVQFLTDGKHDHQVCVVANGTDTDVGGLVLTAIDASGQEVSRHEYSDYRGSKRCYGADLGKGGVPGRWTFRARTGDGRVGEEAIFVHAKLQDSPLSKNPGIPYVAGRPNYDAGIPSQEWRGRLVWETTVDAQGRVTAVSVVTAEGVGSKIRDRAIAAGYMSLFFPDERRANKPLVWKRELSFASD